MQRDEGPIDVDFTVIDEGDREKEPLAISDEFPVTWGVTYALIFGLIPFATHQVIQWLRS